MGKISLNDGSSNLDEISGSQASSSGSTFKGRVTPMRRPLPQKYPSLGLESTSWKWYDAHQVLDLVKLCSAQIKTRGLEVPLILSPLSLDISYKKVQSLLATYERSRSAFENALALSEIVDVATVLKRALSRMRLANAAAISSSRLKSGIVKYETYAAWATEERASNFPPDFLSFCLYPNLESTEAPLLDELLSLLLSVAGHAKRNGMTLSKLCRHFAGWIVDVPELDDHNQSFEGSYNSWQRAAMATEHLFLAYVRQHGHRSPTGLSPSLAACVRDYSSSVDFASEDFVTRHQPLRLLRMSRTVRLRTKDVITSASQWRISTWQSICQNGLEDDTIRGLAQVSEKDFDSLLSLPQSPGSEVPDRIAPPASHAKYRTLSDQQWDQFESLGFTEPAQSLLAFDLKETRRAAAISKRDTVDWTAFSSKGFDERTSLVLSPSDLNFDQKFATETSPLRKQKEFDKRMQKVEKRLPKNVNFEPRLVLLDFVVDETFATSVWLDRVVASRPNGIDDVDWAVLHFRNASIGRDDATNDGSLNAGGGAWILLEEFVPSSLRTNDDRTGGIGNRTASLGATLLGRRNKSQKSSRAASSPAAPLFLVPPKPVEDETPARKSDASTVDLSTLDRLERKPVEVNGGMNEARLKEELASMPPAQDLEALQEEERMATKDHRDMVPYAPSRVMISTLTSTLTPHDLAPSEKRHVSSGAQTAIVHDEYTPHNTKGGPIPAKNGQERRWKSFLARLTFSRHRESKRARGTEVE